MSVALQAALWGAKHCKRSTFPAAATIATGGAGVAITLGALLDGIHEAAAIGVCLLDGEGVALITLLAFFVSNIPKGLSNIVDKKVGGCALNTLFMSLIQ